MAKNEIVFKQSNNFTTRFGTTLNEEQPLVLYLRTKAKVTPTVNKKEYNIDIENVKGEITNYVNNIISYSSYFNKEYLFNIDISSKGLKYGKVSFLRYDLYVKPIEIKRLEEHVYMKDLSENIKNKMNEILNKNNLMFK